MFITRSGLLACLLFTVLTGMACSAGRGNDFSPAQETALLSTPESEMLAGMLPVEKRSLVASLRRTACFGSCPVFFVEIWSDGQVIWQGERYVSRLGKFTAQVSADWITELLQQGERIGYFDLASQYPLHSPLLADLPQTITTLRRGRREHQVLDNADSPLALQHFERWWQDRLETLSWKRVEG